MRTNVTREMFRDKLKRGELDDTVIELEVRDRQPFGMMEVPSQPAAPWAE